MSGGAIVTLIVLIGAIALTAPMLGKYMAKVFGDGPAPGDRLFLPVERACYRLLRVDEKREQRWPQYAMSLLAFSLVGLVMLYALLRLQQHLPGNPNNFGGMTPALSFNTASSFVTNTNWQNYGGESTLGFLAQMAGLAVQNFVSAAVGLAVAVALIRGLARRGSPTIGNFWVDMIRALTRVLVPLSLVVAVLLMSQGVIQNLAANHTITTVEGAQQVIPGGPAASQIAIKQLGTNGGGFFNANSIHPFENPNGFTTFLELYALLLISFSLPFTFGRMVGSRRQGTVVFGVMMTLWLTGSIIASVAETGGNPRLTAVGANQSVTLANADGGNFEGKDVRIGSGTCGIFASSTTGTSTGAVICQHDSMTPVGGMIAMINMKLGEVSPGGVGVGLNGLLVLALLSVFIAGLMVGRTPEYLGKKIQSQEVKLVVLYILIMPAIVLLFTAISSVLDTALASRANPGPHGFSEILYAFTSAGNNNGSAFGGLSGNTQWYNTTLGITMLFGRFFLIIPTLALAGVLGRKQKVPATLGTFPTDTALFGGLVIGVTLIVAGLTFFPALALGPIVEHLSL
jgi:potassium-transporting ATPase potassium-binding subunit